MPLFIDRHDIDVTPEALAQAHMNDLAIQDRDGAVQLAARICASAEAGSIFVSTGVRELCVGKNFAFEPRGTFELKGFDEPVSLFEVGWRMLGGAESVTG